MLEDHEDMKVVAEAGNAVEVLSQAELVSPDADQTVGSWGKDTLLSSSLRTPMPLLRMLTELPYITEVAEEPYRGGEGDVNGAVKNLGGRMTRDSGFTRPKR